MRFLSLDPGLTTGWALWDLQIGYHGRLKLIEYGALVSPVGYKAGKTGRIELRQWLASELRKMPKHDEACTDDDASFNATCIAAVGAFEAARNWCDEHGLCIKGRKRIGEYPRKSGICTVERLSKRSVRVTRSFLDADGSAKEKAQTAVSVPKYRFAVEALVEQPLAGTKVHELDAMAIGIHHAHTAHCWKPSGWIDPKITRQIEQHKAAMDLFRR